MTRALPYTEDQPERAVIDAMTGPAVVIFGTNWCGHCQAAEPLMDAAWATHAEVPRIKVEDGSGRPLGRSFRVKLWPTLVFLRDGHEVARLVRPADAKSIDRELSAIEAT